MPCSAGKRPQETLGEMPVDLNWLSTPVAVYGRSDHTLRRSSIGRDTAAAVHPGRPPINHIPPSRSA